MVSDKKRLHVAIYRSGISNSDERKYHWAFLVGPKVENKQEVPGTKYHVKPHAHGWTFEETPVTDVGADPNLLARLTIVKIKDENRLIEIFRGTPVGSDDRGWRSRTWVEEVLKRLGEDGNVVGRGWLVWEDIESLARQYVVKKSAAGRYCGEKVGREELAPTWSFVDGKETVA